MNGVEWAALASQIGGIQENAIMGTYQIGGDDIARKALVTILGDEFWRNAVDSYLGGDRGSEVIRSIVRLLRPRPVMQRCYEIYKSDIDQETRNYAVILLVDAADSSVLPWVHEFLIDPNEGINVIATWFLDRLLSLNQDHSTDEFADLVHMAETHHSQRVREQLTELRVRERFENSDWRE